MRFTASAILALFALSAGVPSALGDPPVPVPRPQRQVDLTLGPFTLPSNAPTDIVLSGPIEDDAPSQLLRVLRARPDATRIVLSSDGGKVDPALILAKEVHARQLETFIPSGAICYSACAFIFFAGNPHTVATGGSLGVHQIYGGQNPAAIQITFSDVFDTLRGFDVSDRVISQMLRTPPEEMHVFSSAELQELGLAAVASDANLQIAADPLPIEQEREEPAEDPETLDGHQALLLEASDQPGRGALPYTGTLKWSSETDARGVTTLVARADIPARGLGVILQLGRNEDVKVPADHIITFRFTTAPAFEGGAVAELPGVLFKDEELVQGTPLVGVSMRDTTNEFRFFLSKDDAAGNMGMLASKRWMDLALIYSTGRRAIITLERNEGAIELASQAILSWSKQDERRATDSENVTILPMTRTAVESGLGRSERLVTVEGTFRETLLRNGFDAQIYDVMAASLRNVLRPDNIPTGAKLVILMGPARNEPLLISHRLSIYIPDRAAAGTMRHAATAALTDQGNFVLASEPASSPLSTSGEATAPPPVNGDSTYWLKADR